MPVSKKQHLKTIRLL